MAGPLPALAMHQGRAPMQHQHLGLVRIPDPLDRQDRLPRAKGRLDRGLPAPLGGPRLNPNAPMGQAGRSRDRGLDLVAVIALAPY